MKSAQSQDPTCYPRDTKTFAQLSNNKDLTLEPVTKLEDLLNKYSDIFGTSTVERSKTYLVHLYIGTEDSPPIRQKTYHQPAKKRDRLRSQLDGLLKNDIIEESVSRWSSPVILVSKNNGCLPLYLDYRKLFTKTVKDSYQ